MAVKSTLLAGDQNTLWAEGERLAFQHEADTSEMQELRRTVSRMGADVMQLCSEIRTLADAGRWHSGGRDRAGARIEGSSADVRDDIAEVTALVGIYERALNAAVAAGKPEAARIAREFEPLSVENSGYLGAHAWLVHLVRHLEESGADDVIVVSPEFRERLAAVKVELLDGRREVTHLEQHLIAEAASARSCSEGIVTRACKLWDLRQSAQDLTGRTYSGFDLPLLRAAVARRRARPPELDDVTPVLEPAAATPLPGLSPT